MSYFSQILISQQPLTPSPNAGLTVANVKASSGNVFGITVTNPNVAAIYIQFYNDVGVPTLGTNVIWWLSIPASTTFNISPGLAALANFATGIAIGAATTATGAVAPASAPDVVVFYN